MQGVCKWLDRRGLVPPHDRRPLAAVHRAAAPGEQDLLAAVGRCVDHNDAGPVGISIDIDVRGVQDGATGGADFEHVRLVRRCVGLPGFVDPLRALRVILAVVAARAGPRDRAARA